MSSIYICGGSSFHPYECSHDKYCEHCTLAKTDWHNPKKCALCDWLPEGHPDKSKEWKMCKEPFARRIRVTDLSHRKQRLKLAKIDQFIFSLPKVVRQQELPF